MQGAQDQSLRAQRLRARARARELQKAALIAKALDVLNALKRKLSAAPGAGRKAGPAPYPNGAAPGATSAAARAKLALAYLLDAEALEAMLGQLHAALAEVERQALEEPESLMTGYTAWAAAAELLSGSGPCLEEACSLQAGGKI